MENGCIPFFRRGHDAQPLSFSHFKSQIPNPEPRTPHPKPHTPNPKHQNPSRFSGADMMHNRSAALMAHKNKQSSYLNDTVQPHTANFLNTSKPY